MRRDRLLWLLVLALGIYAYTLDRRLRAVDDAAAVSMAGASKLNGLPDPDVVSDNTDRIDGLEQVHLGRLPALQGNEEAIP